MCPYKDRDKQRDYQRAWDKAHRPEHARDFFKWLEDRREIILKEDEYYANKQLGGANLHASEFSRTLKRPIGKRRRQILELTTHQRIVDEPEYGELQDASKIEMH